MATITTTKEFTWAELQDAVNRGEAGNYKEGQIITDTLKDGRRMEYAIAAVNHYQEDEIILMNKISFGDHCMNESGFNTGGWNESDMRRYVNSEILALLPDELQTIIAPRTIVELDEDGNRTASADKLWCLSRMEIAGDSDYVLKCEADKQFPYLQKYINRIVFDEDGYPTIWWGRSPHANYSYYFCGSYGFCGMSSTGTVGSCRGASGSYGVSLGFCIRKSK